MQSESVLPIKRVGSRVDVRVCSPGQDRKVAAQVDGSGSLGSFFPHHCCDDIRAASA
ncbi:hypothetical protein ERY430_80176 [Erythrobacter sp. EC-HK427]|nr:hypothetical protein ERY430_80176 [Erythrobacter sp. EC-HK427]